MYSEKRQTVSISGEILEPALQMVADTFSNKWLSQKDSHPLKVLWQRTDPQSTMELLAIGRAMQEAHMTDNTWLRHQVKLAMSPEKNTYSGAITELLSLFMLNHENNRTKPAQANQAGFDALMTIPESKTIRYSIKDYGQSTHEQNFNDWACKTEDLIKRLLKKHSYPPVVIWIDCPTEYPTKQKWELLHAHLDEIFRQKKNNPDPVALIKGKELDWAVILGPHLATTGVLHPDFNSYSLVMSSVLHKNEHDNLFSKIHDACLNLTEHSAIEDDMVRNFLLIHLSPLAPIIKCTEWVKNYFEEYPNKPISAVLFHQPSIVVNQKKQNVIAHYFHPFIRKERTDNWLPSNFIFNYKLPIGEVALNIPVLQMNFTTPQGVETIIPVDNRYMYQRGNHYIKMQPDGRGGFGGNITQVAPGVFSHIVVELPDQPGKAAIGGRFAPNDELLIL